MGADRNDARRSGRQAFRPMLDNGALESRFLLSHGTVSAAASHRVIFPISAHTFNGGLGVRVRNTAGEFFDIHIAGGGVVRAFPMSGGRTRIVVNGSNVNSTLSIDPANIPAVRGDAHSFAANRVNQNGVLAVGEIDIVSGKIFQVLGYRTASLSGPLVIGGNSVVDRIAFESILPGASIGTGNDLNTLDVYNSATFDGGTGLYVGQDLNWFNIGGSLNIINGANFFAARDIGLQAQPAKGTDPGGVGGVINGNLLIGPGSAFAVGRAIDNPVLIHGNFVGDSQSRIINGGGRVIAFGQIL
jgi:hypothetical protein